MIWLDNAATTKPDATILKKMGEVAEEFFGNPSSSHFSGLAARRVLEEAREKTAQELSVLPEEIIFTPSGSVANNLIIRGVVRPNPKSHVVISAIEHDSVSGPVQALKNQGVRVTEVQPRKDGMIHPEDFASAVCEDTTLACVMHVNNETGVIQPIKELSVLLKRKAPKVLFLSDAVQSAGKMKLTPSLWGVDFMSLSAHKFHGPRGIGALYCKKGVRLPAVMHGGGQEAGIFPGTENVPGAVGLAESLVLCAGHDAQKVKACKDILREKLLSLPDTTENGNGFPYVLNVSFHGIPSEILLNSLSGKGICVSAGSACKTGKSSRTIAAMGGDAKSALRFSLSAQTTPEEAETAANAVCEIVTAFRKGELA